MTVDIYDDLEHLVPAERRDAFLRLSRQIKEYGDHNPELLRLVEVMGFLSLYTNDLPKRIAVEIDRGLAASQAASAGASGSDWRGRTVGSAPPGLVSPTRRPCTALPINSPVARTSALSHGMRMLAESVSAPKFTRPTSKN